MLRNYIIIAFTFCFLSVALFQVQAKEDSISTSTTDILENKAPTYESEPEAAYRNKDFSKSIKLYEAEVSKSKSINQESAELYYNLGNAYFRDNQVAKAIVNYERALLLDPGDSDIRHNLRFARSRIEDKIDSSESFFINRWIRAVQNLYSANAWATLSIVLFIFLIVAAALYMISSRIRIRKVAFYTGIVLIVLVIVTNVFAFKQKEKITNRSTAIVMSASVSIYTSPDAHSQEIFRLHEGAKVNIKREEGRWIEI